MKVPNLIKNDSWLEPFSTTIISRLDNAQQAEQKLLHGQSLSDFAQGHKWYGLHRENKKWIIRDWAPNATAIYLIGQFNNWRWIIFVFKPNICTKQTHQLILFDELPVRRMCLLPICLRTFSIVIKIFNALRSKALNNLSLP
jgi:hypothetical protein